MRKMKRFVAVTLLAALMSVGVPQAFAGEIPTPPVAGPQESPGLTDGNAESPGITLLILMVLDGVLISD